nr:phage tail protein I [uncultured Holophaga sp.]
MSSLIPPSIRDDRSLAVEAVLARLDALPVTGVLASLYDPASCPEAALPLLAHQFGILDQGWALASSVEARREMVANALPLQAKRGTPWSMKQALAAIGWPGMTIQERTNTWAHFKVSQPLSGQALTALDLSRIKAVIEAWKPARCVLDSLDLGVSISSSVEASGPRYDGTYVYDGAINYDSLVLATIAYVRVGDGSSSVDISSLTITSTPTQTVVSFEIDIDTANGLTLNHYALYTEADVLVASTTTVDVVKTSDVTLAVVWTLNLI